VEFVLSRYVETGVEVLDRELLPELLKLKHEAINDALEVLGSSDVITRTFTEFQKHLYQALTA
jgi:type I restriction enzyme R subunit